MRYFLDTEFDGFGGSLISMALVREDGESLYLVDDLEGKDASSPWVRENVVPILHDVPGEVLTICCTKQEMSTYIGKFLQFDDKPQVISDWPDDIRHLCELLITGPGQMVKSAEQLHFTVVRVDAYPTQLKGAVQHNAWWDAMALRELLL